MPASLGRISFSVGPLWTGLISTSLSLAGSSYSLTLQFALGTNTKLLHHLDVSSTHRAIIIPPSVVSIALFKRVPAKHMLPF